jgi:hypothetical protein
MAEFSEVTLPILDPLPHLNGPILPFCEIGIKLFSMAQVIGDDSVNIRQTRRGIALHNRLWGRAILECPDDEFQQDTGCSDTQSARGILSQWRSFSLNYDTHSTVLVGLHSIVGSG